MLAWLAAPAWALTCDEVFQLTATGTPEAEVIARIKAGLDLVPADLTCLQAGGASRAIQDAARFKLAHPSSPAPAPAPAPRPAPPAGAPRVDVAVLGVVLAPGKADGSTWDLDSTGAAVAGVVGTVGLVAVGGVGGAAAARLGQLGASGIAAPDVAGWVELVPLGPADTGPLYRRLGLRGGKDAYEATFEPPARYRGWPLDDLALRVHVWDEDGTERDDAGEVVIRQDELRRALAAPGTYAVPADGATRGQVVSVLLRVTGSALSDRQADGAPPR